MISEAGRVSRLAPRRDRQHRLDARDALGDGLPGAAGRLDGHGLEMVALDQAVVVLHAVDLEHLAAEPDHQRAAEIGMRGIAPLGALQHVEALALRRHAAAGAVHERHHAVDLRIVVEHAGAVDLLGDEARDRCRAVHRGEDADIVARADLAVRPQIALEGGALLRRQQLVVLGAFGEVVVAREIVHARRCAHAPSRPARSASRQSR